MRGSRLTGSLESATVCAPPALCKDGTERIWIAAAAAHGNHIWLWPTLASATFAALRHADPACVASLAGEFQCAWIECKSRTSALFKWIMRRISSLHM